MTASCACGGRWMPENYYLHTDACTDRRRAAFVKRLRGARDLKPIMVECTECLGHGQVEAACDYCGETLTELNASHGSDDCCAACAADGDGA